VTAPIRDLHGTPCRTSKSVEKITKKASSKAREELKPEQTADVLLELRAHQLEIEAQNEELRRSQRELEASRERYFHLFEQAPIGYLTLNHRGVILDANRKAAHLFGLLPRKLVGKLFLDYTYPSDHQVLRKHRRRLLETGTLQSFELRLINSNGSSYWAALQITSSTDSNGRLICRITITDITARIQAERALQEAYHSTEKQVQLRTRELRDTIEELERTRKEREQLQHELLLLSEREKQIIAQDLHDGLCQHLTGTAMLGSLVARRLAQRGDPDAEPAQQICDLLNLGAEEARNLSHGLHPVQAEPEGLMQALVVYASMSSKLFHVDCSLRCDNPVGIENQQAATHLFRIAQEAVTNALRHGKATRVVIELNQTSPNGAVSLVIRDNGTGISREMPPSSGSGMQVMRYRAEVIGATLKIGPRKPGGTTVKCVWPGKV